MTSSTPIGPPGRSAVCPDAEALAALALGEGEPEARRAVADHVIGCAACAADFRLLRELHVEAQRTHRGWSLRSLRTWLVAGAAAALLAIGLAPLLERNRPDAVRGPVASVEPADGALLTSPPDLLAWPAEPGAGGYRVKLFRGDGTPAWESGTVAEPRVPMPEEVRATMKHGENWYWTVESIGPVQRRRMGPFWLRIAP